MLDGLSLIIENMAQANGGSYIDAVLEYQELNEIPDVEDITESLHPHILEKLKTEFKQKNYFPGLKKDNGIPAQFFE